MKLECDLASEIMSTQQLWLSAQDLNIKQKDMKIGRRLYEKKGVWEGIRWGSGGECDYSTFIYV